MDDQKPGPTNASQLASPSYRLAALDQDFLLGDSMRGVRFLLEFAKADDALKAWGVRSTIVVFGSARVREAGTGRQPFWYGEARRFGRIASERGGAMLSAGRPRDNVIATGGGPGIMEAANRGAAEIGAPSIGFNISLPREQVPNPYSTPELTFRFHYFAIRKMHLAMRANALVVFPGGFGTVDEMFEILTLRQTGKAPPIPVVLVDQAYWRSVINFDALIEQGMIDAADMTLFRFAEDAKAIWDGLREDGPSGFLHRGDIGDEVKHVVRRQMEAGHDGVAGRGALADRPNQVRYRKARMQVAEWRGLGQRTGACHADGVTLSAVGLGHAEAARRVRSRRRRRRDGR
jgi:uncharacterized protein (TIGR00730 family)